MQDRVLMTTSALNGEVAPTVSDRVRQIFHAYRETAADLTNELRAVRVLVPLMEVYDHDEDDLECMLRDVMADLRHACDLLGLPLHSVDRVAQGTYEAEVHEEGPAPHISEGWT